MVFCRRPLWKDLDDLKTNNLGLVDINNLLYDFKSCEKHNTIKDLLKFQHDGKEFFFKRLYRDKMFYEVFYSKLLESMGVDCVKYFPARIRNNSECIKELILKRYSNIDLIKCGVLSQDIASLGKDYVEAFRVLSSSSHYDIDGVEKNIEDDPYASLIDEDLRCELLKYMTKECLDELNNYILATSVLGLTDTHMGNYFFYKNDSKNPKFDGVVCIDNERTILDLVKLGVSMIDSPIHTFDDMMEYEYSHSTPLVFIKMSYKDGIKKIKELVASGNISKNQIEFLKRTLLFDSQKLFDSVKNGCYIFKVSNLEIQKEMLERMMEYSRCELGGELNL